MTNATGRAGGVSGTDPCPRCDVLLSRDGVHVLEVVRDDRRMRVTVETPWQPHRVPGLRRGGGLPGPAHPGTCTTCRVRSRSPWRGVSGPGRAVTRAARSWSGVCVVDAVAGDRAGAGHAGRSRVQVRRRGVCPRGRRARVASHAAQREGQGPAARAMDEACRRVQQGPLGHRGDALYTIRNIAHRAADDPTDRQWDRLIEWLRLGGPNDEFLIAWQCYRQVRGACTTLPGHPGGRSRTRTCNLDGRCGHCRVWRVVEVAKQSSGRGPCAATERPSALSSPTIVIGCTGMRCASWSRGVTPRMSRLRRS